MRYKVPQYIEREPKILGPASFSQLGYLAVAAFLILFFFVIFGGTSPVFYVIAFIIGIIGLAFAFSQINGEPLPKYLQKAFLFSFSYKRYFWKQKDYVMKSDTSKKYKKQKEEESKEEGEEEKTQKRRKRRLDDVIRYIETS